MSRYIFVENIFHLLLCTAHYYFLRWLLNNNCCMICQQLTSIPDVQLIMKDMGALLFNIVKCIVCKSVVICPIMED